MTPSNTPTMIDEVFADQDDGSEIARIYLTMPLASQVALLQVAQAMSLPGDAGGG